jgi:hypothetical protein
LALAPPRAAGPPDANVAIESRLRRVDATRIVTGD